MRSLRFLPVVAILCSCASSRDLGSTVDTFFEYGERTAIPEQCDFRSSTEVFRFYAMDGFWERSYYGYELTSKCARYVFDDGDQLRTFVVESQQCVELAGRFSRLREAFAVSLDRAVSGGDFPLPEIAVMDGPIYKLELHNRDVWGHINIVGTASTLNIIPWLGEALHIKDVITKCGDS